MKKKPRKWIIPWKELSELFVLILRIVLGELVKSQTVKAAILVIAVAIGSYTGSESIIEAIPELFKLIESTQEE